MFAIESGSNVQCSNCTINNNFALSGGLIEVLSNGYFSIINSSITNNHAIQVSIAKIFDASEISTIDSSEIFTNTPVSSAEYTSETTSCSKLCFLSTEYKGYVSTNNLHTLTNSEVLFEVISGSFHIKNDSKIHSEQYPLLSLMSDIEVDSSTFSNITFTSTSIQAATSNMTLTNVTFEEISAGSNSELILGDVGSNINLTDVRYRSSNASFCRITSSELYLNQIVLQNIQNSNYLIQMKNMDKSVLQNIEIINSTMTSESMIFFSRSSLIEVNGFIASNNLGKNVLSFENSHVTLVQDVDIQSSLKALDVVQTTVDLINGSTFSQNGNIDSSIGGAITLQNSKATIVNSTFNQNVGTRGGAVALECTSLTL